MNEQVTRCHSSLKNEHATDIDISEYEDLFSFINNYSEKYVEKQKIKITKKQT